MKEAKLFDLGWCMAKYDPNGPKLIVISPADYGDGSYTPAESIVIYGKLHLRKLKDALNAMDLGE